MGFRPSEGSAGDLHQRYWHFAGQSIVLNKVEKKEEDHALDDRRWRML
jgi:hypothetical protein